MESTTTNNNVARITRQLTLEYEATQRGLLEATYGVDKNDFMAARLASMVDLQEALVNIVGSTEANTLLVQALNAAHITYIR
jgi:hypothetical protein